MKCPYCNQEHADDLKYCPKTGKELVASVNCPQCGNLVELTWKHCGFCGQDLRKQIEDNNLPATPPPVIQQSERNTVIHRKPYQYILVGLSGLILLFVFVIVLWSIWKPEGNFLFRLSNIFVRDQTSTPSLIPSKLVFTSDRDGNSEIYTMDADGTNQTRLTNSTFFDGGASWSSDGDNVVFFTDRDGNAEIYSMSQDGSHQSNLSNNPWDDTFPDWSPDMKKITFESIRDGNKEIYIMNANGNNQVRLTENQEDDYSPGWSPDGQKIAFTSVRNGNSEIFVMNADGSNQTNLSNNPAEENYPLWSGDGKKIAFDSYRDGLWELYTMNIDGTDQTRLTFNIGYNRYADWSPDGQKFVYVLNDGGNNYDLYIMNADGSNITPILRDTANAWEPKWSQGTTKFINIINTPMAISPTAAITQVLQTPTVEPTSQPTTQKVNFPIEEVGWIEIISTGTVNLDQDEPTQLNQALVFHGPNSSGEGFGCNGCYVLEPLPNVIVIVPPEDSASAGTIFHSGDTFQYLIKATQSDRTLDDFFLGSLPIYEVTYLERLK